MDFKVLDVAFHFTKIDFAKSVFNTKASKTKFGMQDETRNKIIEYLWCSEERIIQLCMKVSISFEQLRSVAELLRVYSENSCQLLKLMRVDDESCMAAILYNSSNQAKIASCVFFVGLKLANSSPGNV